MKKTNRIIAMLICIAMIISMVPTTLAEELAIETEPEFVYEAPPVFGFEEESNTASNEESEIVIKNEVQEIETVESSKNFEEVFEEEIVNEETFEDEVIEEEIVSEETFEDEVIEEEIVNEEVFEDEVIEEEIVSEETFEDEIIEEEIVDEEIFEEEALVEPMMLKAKRVDPATCEHDWKEYDMLNVYEPCDSKTHILVANSITHECKKCKERYEDVFKSNNPVTSEHNFNSKGVCNECGYVEVDYEEEHEHTWKKYDIENCYEVVDKNYHIMTMQYQEKKCKECGEWEIDEYPVKNLQKEEHYFNSKGKCSVCGYVYEEDEEEPIIEVTPTPTLEATLEPSEEPIVETTPEPKETLKPFEEPIVPVHEHDWKEYDIRNSYEPIDNEYHILVAQIQAWECQDCGELETLENPVCGASKELHNFDTNGKCYSCGYIYKSEYIDQEVTPMPTEASEPTPTAKSTPKPTPVVEEDNIFVPTPKPKAEPTKQPTKTEVVTQKQWTPPTALEAAKMAKHMYDDIPIITYGSQKETSDNADARTIEGWTQVAVYYGKESLKMGIYVREGEDINNASGYAIVFRGTKLTDLSCWKNNFESKLSDNSTDMWEAINRSLQFDANHSQDIIFIGHSKGGGEALAAALATGKPAITFNAANFDFSNYGLPTIAQGNIDNYYIKGEWLSTLIKAADRGNTIWLETQVQASPTFIRGANSTEITESMQPDLLENHAIDNVIKALE